MAHYTRRLMLAAASLALALTSASIGPVTAAVTTTGPTAGGAQDAATVRDHWIVVLRDDTTAAAAANVRADAVRAGGVISHTYASVLHGFSLALPEHALQRLRRNPTIAYVEADVVAHASINTQSVSPWNLDRIDTAGTYLGMDGMYTYDSTAGAGVDVYVLDTGIYVGHPDFGGRATVDWSAYVPKRDGGDCNGHGTHVAGTIGGTQYGVAKRARLHGIRVLGCSGSGTTSGLLAGLDYVSQQRVSRPSGAMVVNMSLGFGVVVASVNQAVDALAAQDVVVVVAAGNANQDSCTDSPASAAGAFVVAATDASDQRASFSDYGPCVDINAPGVQITSDWIQPAKGKRQAAPTNTISGTSMASPHGAGAAAVIAGAHPGASAVEIVVYLETYANMNTVVGAMPSTTASLLLLPSTP